MGTHGGASVRTTRAKIPGLTTGNAGTSPRGARGTHHTGGQIPHPAPTVVPNTPLTAQQQAQLKTLRAQVPHLQRAVNVYGRFAQHAINQGNPARTGMAYQRQAHAQAQLATFTRLQAQQRRAAAAKGVATRAANKAAKAGASQAAYQNLLAGTPRKPTAAAGSANAWARGQSGRLNLPNGHNQSINVGRPDPGLVKIAEEKGITVNAQTATKAQMDQLVAGGAKEFWRGVTTTNTSLSKTQAQATVQGYVQSLIGGPYYPRTGKWGSGMYVATGKNAQSIATHYATKAPAGVVLRGVFLPSARVGNSAALDQQRKADGAAFMRSKGVSHPSQLRTADFNQFTLNFGDVGRYAATKGYDVINVTHNTKYAGEMYILNRGAIVVQQ